MEPDQTLLSKAMSEWRQKHSGNGRARSRSRHGPAVDPAQSRSRRCHDRSPQDPRTGTNCTAIPHPPSFPRPPPPPDWLPQPQQESDVGDLSESSDDGPRPGETFSAWEARINFPPGVQLPRWPLADFQKPRSEPKRLSLPVSSQGSASEPRVGQQPRERQRTSSARASMTASSQGSASEPRVGTPSNGVVLVHWIIAW